MASDEFPIGQALTALAIVEYKEFGGNELCLEKVNLFFHDTTVTLITIADTDEIEIIHETTTASSPADTPSWCKPFIGKHLMTGWVCDNAQGYTDQVIFAFEHLRPSIAFIAEGSVLKVFRYQQISRVISETPWQHEPCILK